MYTGGKEELRPLLWTLLSLPESEEDRRTLRALYDRYGGAMLRVAGRYFPGDPRSAEDAVQNAWIKVIKHFSKLSEIPCKKQGAWLVVIVKNEAITLLRRRRDAPLEDWAEAAAADEDGKLEAEAIAEVIRRMPETYRAVLELRLLEERTNREIARALGVSEAAVGARYSRGLALLREKLLEEGFVP